MQQIISKETRAVSIYSQTAHKYDARLYVNCEPDASSHMQLGDATLTCNTFKSLAGAHRWAQKVLAN
jgi:hypothetical protein